MVPSFSFGASFCGPASGVHLGDTKGHTAGGRRLRSVCLASQWSQAAKGSRTKLRKQHQKAYSQWQNARPKGTFDGSTAKCRRNRLDGKMPLHRTAYLLLGHLSWQASDNSSWASLMKRAGHVVLAL